MSIGAQINFYCNENNSSGVGVAEDVTYLSGANLPTSAALNTQRYSNTFTVQNSATVSLTPYVQFGIPGTGPINFTLRVGMPQLELGAFSTSVIPTSGSAVTRQADSFTVPVTAAGANGAWYTQGVGTFGSAATLNTSMSNATVGFGVFDVDNGTGSYAMQHLLDVGTYYFEMFDGGGFLDCSSDGNGSFTYGTVAKAAMA